MKKITHHYGVELDWVEPLAEELEGKVDGNFILVPDYIHTGDRYVLNCDPNISALYLDVVYHSEIHFRQVNKTDDFIGVYYNLTEGRVALLSDDNINRIGKWSYNMAIIDSALHSDYIVKRGSETFALNIFIKKEAIKEYFKNNLTQKKHIDNILNPEKNTIINLTRMSNKSYNLLMDLRSKKVEDTSFEFHLKGTVLNLIAEFIEKMSFDEIIIDTVNEDDLAHIMRSKIYLTENIKGAFPGIPFLAKEVNMSVSKYKKLFRKITGMTPNYFFMNSKLLESKRLLEEKQLTIRQVSEKLNFSGSSYFIIKFKESFGMSPKNFIKQLQ
ncbi:AraC family transcriptional regulator [Flavobacterium sp. LS1R47]|uniref:AraC family transcriptional regulator n=1 Tax=Flavobacterium frigoritolerans TaxID=2987686 RepID=A0A9X3HMY8_9FLAO|nr:AraC family transcriptional regulator [Flavobacterium frigoritolerans]MCV9934327.1 AraC family transcriptional regulator [Flavobacterium frigoritolerans]